MQCESLLKTMGIDQTGTFKIYLYSLKLGAAVKKIVLI